MNIFTSIEIDPPHTPTVHSKRKSHSVHLIEKTILNRASLLPPNSPKPPLNKISCNPKMELNKFSQIKNFKTLNKHGLKLDFNNIVYSPYNESPVISSNSYKYNDSPTNNKRINNNFQNLKNILDKNLIQNNEKEHNFSFGFPNFHMKFLYGNKRNTSFLGLSPYNKIPKPQKAIIKPNSPSTVSKF